MGVSLAVGSTHAAGSLFQLDPGWQIDLPSLAIGLLLGLGLAFFVARLWPRLRRLRDQSLSRVRETEAWARAGVEKRFMAETEAYVQAYHLGASRATLAEIFVEPRPLAERPPVEVGETSPATSPNLNYLWPEVAGAVGTLPPATMSVRRLLLNGKRVILSAPAGTGKTTLLAYCAYVCARAGESGPYTFLQPVMPALLHLAELSPAAEDGETGGEEANPAAPLAHALQARAGPLTAPGVAGLLQQKLADGHVLLLLDGWDELAAESRQPVVAWLARLLERYPTIQVIAATGPDGFAPLQSLRFTVSGLIPWRAHRAQMLGERWADRFGRASTPGLEHFWEPGQIVLATTMRLWRWDARRAAAPTRLSALLETTLEGFLPALNRAGGEPDAAGGGPSPLPEEARNLWQRLAYRLVVKGRLSLGPAAILQEIEAVLAAGSRERLQGVLRESVTQSALFRKWPDGRVSFLSPLWRDFLAAAHLVQEEGWDLILAHLDDPCWQGVIRFYVARTGGDHLAPRLLDAARNDLWQEDLFRVASWLPEPVGQAAWRSQTLTRLGQMAIKPETPGVVRQRALTLIARSGEDGVTTLLRQLLQRREPALRKAAVMALASLDPELSVPALERMLDDQDVEVRVTAVHALGWQNSGLGEKPLLLALISRDEAQRTAAAQALALNGGEGWEILREAATDDELLVRRAAIHGLLLLDEYWAVQLLEEMERVDDEWVVKTAATMALETIAERNRKQPWEMVEAGELVWLVEWAAAREEAVPGGNAALPTLCRVLAEAEREEYRVAAARSLARVYLPRAEREAVRVALRTAAVDDPDWSVREHAYASLAELERGEKA